MNNAQLTHPGITLHNIYPCSAQSCTKIFKVAHFSRGKQAGSHPLL